MVVETIVWPVTRPSRKRELGRGERVLPGVWRLRLPLSLPGVPHCNAWALAAGDGLVLVDTGMHEPGALAQLESALEQVGRRLEDVRLVVCTHAHPDHVGQAPAIRERLGCELWLHPDHAHHTAAASDPEQALARLIEIARQSGVPELPLRAWATQRREQGTGIAGPVTVDRDLVDGVEVASDLGTWRAVETPGHAPSHVCLHLPEGRMLISGDHLLGRVSLYFDYGFTEDPVGEFLRSLERVDALDARLALSGHGRPFTDVRGHVEANRELVHRRLGAVRAALREGPQTAYALAQQVYGDLFGDETATWLMTKTLCWLRHLEVTGEARRLEGERERWIAAKT
jgi:glyoxylase-like metal-dependent hydrolase (beta-lactamase superfamily II)